MFTLDLADLQFELLFSPESLQKRLERALLDELTLDLLSLAVLQIEVVPPFDLFFGDVAPWEAVQFLLQGIPPRLQGFQLAVQYIQYGYGGSPPFLKR